MTTRRTYAEVAAEAARATNWSPPDFYAGVVAGLNPNRPRSSVAAVSPEVSHNLAPHSNDAAAPRPQQQGVVETGGSRLGPLPAPLYRILERNYSLKSVSLHCGDWASMPEDEDDDD